MTPIQILFLAGLAGGWLALVFPLAIRGRHASVHGSAAGFERAMAVLKRDSEFTMSSPTTASVPDDASLHRRAASQVERAADDSLLLMRRLFVGSLVAVLATAGAAIAWGGVFWTLFVVAAVATGGYVTVLRHRKLEADRAKAVIRSIRTDARTYVGRENPHLYESLPSMVEGLAHERHFPGSDTRLPQDARPARSAVEVF